MTATAPGPDLTRAVLTDHCHLRIPSLPDWIEPTVTYLVRRAMGCGAVHPGRATRVLLALHEALTNAILHGNLGISSDLKGSGEGAFARAVADRCADPAYSLRPVEVEADYDGAEARWAFTDQGGGFDHEEAFRRIDREDIDPHAPAGRGLIMIRAFMDGVRYEAGGRRLVLTARREPGAERRGHPRQPFLRQVQVTPLDGGEADWTATHDAVARDLSSDGIAFLQQHLPPSRRVLITLPGEGGRPISLPAEVRHWHRLGDQVVEVGCRFEAPSVGRLTGAPGVDGETAQALQALVGRLAGRPTPALEMRSAPRVPYTQTIAVRLPDDTTVSGYGRDLSLGGVAFFCTREVPLDVVLLHLPGHDGPTIDVRAQVVRCTRLLDGFHDVAARFLPS